MNRITVNHMKVYDMLNTFYLKYKAILSLNIMIAALFAMLEINRQRLIALGIAQGGDNTGIAEGKQDLRTTLVKEILLNSGSASVCCYNLGNKDLYKKLKLRKSGLDRLSGQLLVQAAESFVNDCTTNLALLAPSGVTAPSLMKISNAATAFSTDIEDPTISIKNIAVITEQIAETEKASQVILTVELIDGMSIYMESDPAMYSEFLKMTKSPKVGVRKATGPRAAKANVSAIILDDSTSKPIMDAEVRFVGKKGAFKTDAAGNINTSLSIGAQMGKIVAVGYVNQSFAFTLTEAGYIITIRMIAE